MDPFYPDELELIVNASKVNGARRSDDTDDRRQTQESRLLLVLAAVLIGLAVFLVTSRGKGQSPDAGGPTEAPAGFVLVTNGLIDQEEFKANLAQFIEEATVTASDDGEGGLGPTFNAASCAACHSNPVVGAGSQIAELRVGHWDGATFSAPKGGTLIRLRAIRAELQPKVPEGFEVRARRMSPSLFGLGYVEALSDAAILQVQSNQAIEVRGTVLLVDVTVGVNPDGSPAKVKRIGRFGWKDQHGSLADFAADANLNEKGITSPLQPDEAPFPDGRQVTEDAVADPEDPPAEGAPFGKDIKAYTRFMRALRAPPRVWATQTSADVIAGEKVFSTVGCAQCHVPTWVTAPVGSTPRGSQAIPAALGDKIIHPYSDFLLHDIGTGDGIDQGGGPDTRNKMRTAPLWGLRARPELMHDGLSYTLRDAIERHAGQAAGVRDRYRVLPESDKKALDAFALSL